MTIRDLDRLISKTDINPVSKTALKRVRTAIMSGRCGNPEIGKGSWSVAIDTFGGRQFKMNFSFKRDDDVHR